MRKDIFILLYRIYYKLQEFSQAEQNLKEWQNELARLDYHKLFLFLTKNNIVDTEINLILGDQKSILRAQDNINILRMEEKKLKGAQTLLVLFLSISGICLLIILILFFLNLRKPSENLIDNMFSVLFFGIFETSAFFIHTFIESENVIINFLAFIIVAGFIFVLDNILEMKSSSSPKPVSHKMKIAEYFNLTHQKDEENLLVPTDAPILSNINGQEDNL